VTYGICCGRYDSSLGHNALVCTNKFKMNVCDIVSGIQERKVYSGTADAGGWLFIRDGHSVTFIYGVYGALACGDLHYLLPVERSAISDD